MRGEGEWFGIAVWVMCPNEKNRNAYIGVKVTKEVTDMSAVAGYGTSTAAILVLYILLVIVLSAGFFI